MSFFPLIFEAPNQNFPYPNINSKLISFGFCSKKIWRRKSDVFCHVNKSEVQCWISHWISDIWNNWSFLQKVVLWRCLMLQVSVYDCEILSKQRIRSIPYWEDSVIIWEIPQGLSLKHCWKIQQHSWEVRREANNFKRPKKHYNVKVMRFSTAEDVLIWMKWQIQEIWFMVLYFASQIFTLCLFMTLSDNRQMINIFRSD